VAERAALTDPVAHSASSGSARRSCLLLISHLGRGGTREVLSFVNQELGKSLELNIASLYRGSDASNLDFPCRVLVDREEIGFFGYLEAVIKLAKLIVVTRPAVVLTFMPAANVLGATLSFLSGTPRRISTHHQPGWTQAKLLKHVDLLLGAIGGYSHVLAVSQSIGASFERYPRSYRGRIVVIPTAVKPIAATSSREEVRRRWEIGPNETLAVAIGRFSPEKNLLNTLAAVARTPQVRFVLVGDGPLRAELEQFVRANRLGAQVIFAGHQPRQHAIDMLFAADIFIQLSHFEGRSLALLEALCAEKAIIASDIPAQREALTGKGGEAAGLLCDPNDVDAIASALRSTVSDESLRRELAGRAARIKAELDPGTMMRAYLALFG
jgi:glycosyltransferase involved in cell wall biosynthesis